jgi:hypothetical protein
LLHLANKISKESENDIAQANRSSGDARRLHENRLADLALAWDYIDGAASILQQRQEEMTKMKLEVNCKIGK